MEARMRELSRSNQHRVRKGRGASDDDYGNNGCFEFTHAGLTFFAIASDGEGWEHVSISIPGRNRCPTWEQMCDIKAMFWDEKDCVMQLHPPQSEYVNNHPYCLHLWRPVEREIPIPEAWLVGIKGLTLA
jgi:hypothetical protein